MATNNDTDIDLLKDKKVLAYPASIGNKNGISFGTIGSTSKDLYQQDEQYVIFKINVDTSATKLRDDAILGGVVVPTGTRLGTGVGAGPNSNILNKTYDEDLKIRFGTGAVKEQDFLIQKGMVSLDRTIVLPMPMEYNVGTNLDYSAKFDTTDLTMLGDYMNSTPGAVISDLFSKYKNKAISGIVNTIKSGATNEQALLAEDRLAKNPKKEVMYESIGFRNFKFTYQFAPKNKVESDTVKEIIETFRYYALPEMTAGKMHYKMPGEFQIMFMLGQVDNPNIPKMTTCALTSVGVNYMPNGVWSALPNGAPTALSLNLEFLELEIVDRRRVYTRNSPIISGY